MNKKEHHVKCAQMIDHLDEAKEHLEDLIDKMANADEFCDTFFTVDLAHIYAHLNRVCNSRNSGKLLTDENWDIITEFPKDIYPVG